jgi:hypothetical protein
MRDLLPTREQDPHIVTFTVQKELHPVYFAACLFRHLFPNKLRVLSRHSLQILQPLSEIIILQVSLVHVPFAPLQHLNELGFVVAHPRGWRVHALQTLPERAKG